MALIDVKRGDFKDLREREKVVRDFKRDVHGPIMQERTGLTPEEVRQQQIRDLGTTAVRVLPDIDIPIAPREQSELNEDTAVPHTA